MNIPKIIDELALCLAAAERALATWGPKVQMAKAREEMAELATEIARLDQKWAGHRPERASSERVAEEAADVVITVIQVGIAVAGRAGFAATLERKRGRLEDLLSDKEDHDDPGM